jgi:hypothetical protein
MFEILAYIFFILAILSVLYILLAIFVERILIPYIEAHYIDARGYRIVFHKIVRDKPFKLYTEQHLSLTVIHYKGFYRVLYQFLKGPKHIYRKSNHPELLI